MLKVLNLGTSEQIVDFFVIISWREITLLSVVSRWKNKLCEKLRWLHLMTVGRPESFDGLCQRLAPLAAMTVCRTILLFVLSARLYFFTDLINRQRLLLQIYLFSFMNFSNLSQIWPKILIIVRFFSIIHAVKILRFR